MLVRDTVEGPHVSDTEPTTRTFSFRVPANIHRLLQAVAATRKQTVPQLCLDICKDAAATAMTPEEIETAIEQARRELLDAAKRLRAERD